MEQFGKIFEEAYPSFGEAFPGAKIKVIGAGGGGSNAVQHMVRNKVQGVDFAIANTDIQALQASDVPEKIQLGMKLTRGLGAGGNPEVGRKAAEESMDEIKKAVEGYDMVFIAAGLGGGSGTGSAPVIADVAKKCGALTVAVVTLPFSFEGKVRMRKAIEGRRVLSEFVDTMITIPNDKLSQYLNSLGRRLNMKRALEEVDNVLLQAVSGITNLITKPGVINLDFADVKTVMSIKGSAIMGVGVGSGEDRIREATEKAMRNPLLTHDISGAKGILINITGNDNLEYEDFLAANEIISSYVDEEECEYMVGTAIDESIPDNTVNVTIVATGFEDKLLNAENQTSYGRRNVLDFGKSSYSVNEKHQLENDYVRKEMSNIFEGIEIPQFMKKFGNS